MSYFRIQQVLETRKSTLGRRRCAFLLFRQELIEMLARFEFHFSPLAVPY